MITFNRNAGTFYRQHTPEVSEMRSYLKSQPNSRFGNFIKNFGGPVAGGILGLGSQIFNGVMSSIQQQKEYDQQLDQWRRENFYNHPVNQRIRLQAAGLNPAAAAGDIAQSNTAGGLSSVPSADAIKSGVIDVSSLVESLQAISQVEKIAADKDLVTSNIALAFYKKIAEQVGIRGKQLDNMMAEIKVSRYPELLSSEIYKNTAQGDHSAASAEDLYATRESRIQKALAEGNYSQALADSENLIRDSRKAFIDAQTEEARANASRANADAWLSKIRAEYEPLDSQSRRNLNKADYEMLKQQVMEMRNTWSKRLHMLTAEYNITLSNEKLAEFNAKVKEATENISQLPDFSEQNIFEYLERQSESLALILANVISEASLGAVVGVKYDGNDTKVPHRRIGY